MKRISALLASGFVLGAGLALIIGCDILAQDWNKAREDFHYSYPLGAGGKVEVQNQNGPVEITGWDQNVVDISGTKYANTEEGLKDIRIDVNTTTGSVSIRTVRPQVSIGSLMVRYVIRVPRGAELAQVITSNGPISVDDVDAASYLRTSNGPVRVGSLKGPVDIQTSNGPIRVADTAGPATLRTSNGPIDVSLSSVAEVRARTSNGPITLRIPSEAGATLKAHTSHGPIHTDFAVATQNRSEHDVEGTIGAGGPLLDLTTSNGPIRIARR